MSLSIYLSIFYLFIYLFLRLRENRDLFFDDRLIVRLNVTAILSIYLSIYLPIYLSISIYLRLPENRDSSVERHCYLSIYLSIYLRLRENRDLLSDDRLIVRLNDKYVSWAAAAPIILSVALYKVRDGRLLFFLSSYYFFFLSSLLLHGFLKVFFYSFFFKRLRLRLWLQGAKNAWLQLPSPRKKRSKNYDFFF